MQLVDTPDSRNYCPENVLAGSYYVQKRNIIKQFRFGDVVDSEYQDIKTAFSEMKRFLASRKDSDSLTVTLINS